MKGLTGFVSGQNNEKFVVILEALGQAIRLEINQLLVKKRK
jgi:hypothetical protein